MKVTKDLRAYLDSEAPGWNDVTDPDAVCCGEDGPIGLVCILPEGHRGNGIILHVATGGADRVYAIWSP